MSALFWIFWIVDLLLCVVAVIGRGFANSFHQSSSVPWLAILLIGCTVVGLLLQVFFRKPTYALIAAALPLLTMFGLYVYEKIMGV